jgi:hypothetical protein
MYTHINTCKDTHINRQLSTYMKKAHGRLSDMTMYAYNNMHIPIACCLERIPFTRFLACCMCVYVYMYVCMYVCMYSLYIYIYIYTHTHTYIYIYTGLYIYTVMHTCKHTDTCDHICVCTKWYQYVYRHVYIQICIVLYCIITYKNIDNEHRDEQHM